jgi:hypothetical protein
MYESRHYVDRSAYPLRAAIRMRHWKSNRKATVLPKRRKAAQKWDSIFSRMWPD